MGDGEECLSTLESGYVGVGGIERLCISERVSKGVTAEAACASASARASVSYPLVAGLLLQLLLLPRSHRRAASAGNPGT